MVMCNLDYCTNGKINLELLHVCDLYCYMTDAYVKMNIA